MPVHAADLFPILEMRDADRAEELRALDQAGDWDIAVRYHEFKHRLGIGAENEKRIQALRRISAQAVLDRARAVLGSVVHVLEQKVVALSALPANRVTEELDLEETLDHALPGVAGALALSPEDIFMSVQVPRRQTLILCLDTSLSMTGEKLALTAVSVAVVLLQFPDDPIGIVAFENEARVLKRPEETISIVELVERFLDVPAQGYTHLEEGLRTAIEMLWAVKSDASAISGVRRVPSMVLVSDGKYTAGKDPAYLASRVPHLEVVKMGSDRSSRALCEDLAQRGQGSMREVENLEDLPVVMYGVVKDLLRGRGTR